METLHCEDVTEWIEETIERPLEEWVEERQTRCRNQECNWWVLCLNKVVCWVVVTLVRVVIWVIDTVMKPVVRVVCEVVARVVGAVIDLISFLVPLWKNYDVHIHLFNWRTAAIFLMEAVIMVIRNDPPMGGGESPVKPEEEELDAERILALLHSLHIWKETESWQVFFHLREVLGYRYIAVPCMLDLTYCTDDDKLLAVSHRFQETLGELARWAQTVPAPQGSEIQSLIEDLLLLDLLIPGVDFYEQASQLIEVRRRYRNLVFPFLSVDPRRPNILDYVKDMVGPGKPFHGVKLYAPTGYSPTDPVLFDILPDRPDCVYKYCQDNRIPITAHCSPGGFGTIARSVHVRGHIYVDKDWSVSVDDQVYEGGEDGQLYKVDGDLHFNKTLENSDFRIVAQERSRLLNHPEIWRIVLDRYPELYLNLAHFGGDKELKAYAEDPDGKGNGKRSWSKIIVGLMQDYPNLYTDLSCHYKYEIVRDFKENVFDSLEVKERIMYGSDFPMVLLSVPFLRDYEKQHRDIFGKAEFKNLTTRNPRNFLFERPSGLVSGGVAVGWLNSVR